MSTSTEVAVESTDVNEAPAPFLTFQPNRTKVNPTKWVGEGSLYVTESPAGKLRAALLTDSEVDLPLGLVIEAKHFTRKTTYGLVTVVGRVTATDADAERVYEGQTPDANLSLRIVKLIG